MHHFKFFFFFLSLYVPFAFIQGLETSALPLPLTAEKRPLIPRQLLFGNPEKANPKISPDGHLLAFLAPSKEGVLNIWVQKLDNQEALASPLMVTQDTKRGIRQFMWTADSASLLYIQDKDGDENEHLYLTDLKQRKVKDLTPFEGVKASILAGEPLLPDELLILMNQEDKTLFDVYRLNLKEGSLKLDTKNPGGVIQWIADHQLQVRGSISLQEEGSTKIQMRADAKTPWQTWKVIPALESGSIENFSRDNQSFYFLTNVSSNTTRLVQVDPQTQTETLIAEDPDYDLSGILFDPSSYTIEAISVEKEKPHWTWIDPKVQEDFRFLQKNLGDSFSLVSRDLANQQWVIAAYSDQRPTRFYLYQRRSHSLQFLFTTQKELERFPLSAMTPIAFKARDGLTLQGYLTLPYGEETLKHPSVLLVHGGPWSRDSWGLQPMVQWLANRGYTVLQVNFRGSTGFGKAFVNAGNREWGNKMLEDLIDAKEWLIQGGYSDRENIAIAGGSYGGYATLAALAFSPDEFCCGIDIVGPSNLVTLLQTLPPYWKPLQVMMDIRVGKLETEKTFLESRSPLFKAHQINKPLLIAQGANDPRVKQAESDQIVQAMRKNNIAVDYLLFSDEGHGFVRPENKLKFYAAAESFLAKHLKGRLEPLKEEENWKEVAR